VTVTDVLADRTPALETGLESIPTALSALTSIVHGDRGDFTLIGAQGPVCWYDTARRTVGDVSPRAPNLALFCPPGDNLAQRGSRNAPRPNDLGLARATTPGNVTGPPIVDDPILIPTGIDVIEQWTRMLQGTQP
jgi:phospholipid/cholesterol/gamma-HCH transport system substrate-binding protein